MKKMFHILLVFPLLLLGIAGTTFASVINNEFDPALSGGTLVDFESGPAGTWVTQSFGGLTVTAQNSTYAPNATFSVAGDYAGDYNTRGRYHITNYGTDFQILRFDFAAPVSALGFLFGASDSSWTLSAYNSGGLLESYNILPVNASNAGDFFGLAGLSGATYAIITQNQDYYYNTGGVDYVFVDNFRYQEGGGSSVPEPATMLLLGLGLLGIAGIRRK